VTSMTRIVVVSAGVGVPSATRLLADRLSQAVSGALGDHDVELTQVELRPLAHPLADRVLTGFADEALQAALDAVSAADGVVVVTPVYAASYSGLFKQFFDVVDPGSLEGTPVLLAATAGTARHSLVVEHALRPLFSYLRAVPVPTGVFAATDDFGRDADLSGRIARAAAELALAVRPAARVAAPVTPRPRLTAARDDDPVPFEELLRQASSGG
jgi:FMN reductase